MTETNETPVVVDKKTELSGAEFLATLVGAPSAEQVEAWKQQAPNNRIELFTPDGKRAYIVRGITGTELAQIQKQVQGMATPSSDPDLEVQIAAVVRSTLWTNVGSGGHLTDVILRTGAAGLPSTLFAKVTKLSDFFDPQQIEFLSAEL